jgi:hypothetical protein
MEFNGSEYYTEIFTDTLTTIAKKPLSPGAIAGIVIGVLSAIAGAGGVVFAIRSCRKELTSEEESNE